MGSRRGLGKAKHIDTVFHWAQCYVSEGEVKPFKRHTSEMLADLLTKPVSEALTNKVLKEMNFVFKEGTRVSTRSVAHEFTSPFRR